MQGFLLFIWKFNLVLLCMAYDKDKIIAEILEIIPREEITQFDEICLFVEPSLRTLYEWSLHELHDIKEAIGKVKIGAKKKLRKNWKDSDNPTLQIAAFKLMASNEELEKLTLTKVTSENTTELKGGLIIELDDSNQPVTTKG